MCGRLARAPTSQLFKETKKSWSRRSVWGGGSLWKKNGLPNEKEDMLKGTEEGKRRREKHIEVMERTTF